MKVINKGFDPNLGATFAQEWSGLIIGRGKSSRKSKRQEEDEIEDEYEADMQAFAEEHGREPWSDQELFDFLNGDDSE